MKKHNEGYTLPLVMVVMVILCLVAVSIMSVALRNLKAQQASVQRMQDQYVAAGMIEKVVAQLESIGESEHGSLLVFYNNSVPEVSDEETEEIIEGVTDEPELPLKMYITSNTHLDQSGNQQYYAIDAVDVANWTSPLTVRLIAISGQVQITCELELAYNTYQINGSYGGPYEVCVSKPAVTYLSYEVDYITTSETGGGQE